jgi:hypothetical protein
VASNIGTGAAAASTFRLDVKGAELRHSLEAAGVRPVLLKGPALGNLLYPDQPRSRLYSDVDLLIDPDAMPRTERLLAAAGFRRLDRESTVRGTDLALGRAVGAHGAAHATTWLRDRDQLTVDLHDSLPQCGAPARVVWQHITRHLDVLTVGGVRTETLDRPASALLIALHAAHHGPRWGRAAMDLERALTVFDDHCWGAARELAVALDAQAAMGVGLGTSAEGRALARRLSLVTEPTTAQRLLWDGAPWSATVLEALIAQRGLRARMRVLAQVLWPTPAALRRGSALARRGRRGLIAAYAIRPLQLARLLPGAVRACRR